MTVTTVTVWRWRLLIYALRNILLCNNVMCFQKQPPFLKVSQILQENTCVESLFSLEMMKLYRHLFCINKSGSALSESRKWCNLLANFFFQSTFEVNEMFCLLNKFVIFTNQKPVLKILVDQQSLTIVKTFVTTKKPCLSHHDCHYLDIAITFIYFNSFANSSKIICAII